MTVQIYVTEEMEQIYEEAMHEMEEMAEPWIHGQVFQHFLHEEMFQYARTLQREHGIHTGTIHFIHPEYEYEAYEFHIQGGMIY